MTPNRDLDQAGHLLMNVMALSFQQARAHLATEVSYCDGYPAGNDSPNVTASAELTSVERAASTRYDLSTIDLELQALKVETLGMIRLLNEAINRAAGIRVPRTIVRPEDKKKNLCCTGQTGLEGAIVWGDPLCMMPNVKKGLCQAHYSKYRRHCESLGIDRSRDYEPAT
jgi:hypothetical protein